MRKERMVAMLFLIVVLAGVLALPQGFAKTKVTKVGTKNFGNRPTKSVVSVPTPPPPITTHQSRNGLLGQSSYHLEGLGNVHSPHL
jgi:hypothetical protein